MGKGYTIVQKLNDEVKELDKKIDNIGDDNIIGHSTVEDINGLIKDINKDIKKVDRKNRRMACIKNIRIFGTFIRFFFPFVIAIGMAFGFHNWLTKDIPFYPQRVFKFAHHNESIDKTGIVSDDVIYSSDKSNRGNSAEIITKWDLHMDEAFGMTKYDFLVTEVQDKLVETIRLLQKYNKIDSDLSLREVYNKYFHPEVLPLNNDKIWKALQENSVLNVFQFDSDVGSQAAKKIKPTNVLEMADANGSSVGPNTLFRLSAGSRKRLTGNPKLI